MISHIGKGKSSAQLREVDPEKQQLSVSKRPGASDYTIGEKVNGKVPETEFPMRFSTEQLSRRCDLKSKKPGKKN